MSHATVHETYALHARLCKAITDPKRLLILDALRHGERAVCDIADELELSQPNTSHHLAILRERNVVTTSRSGNTIYYALNSWTVIDVIDLLGRFMAEIVIDGAAIVTEDGVATVGNSESVTSDQRVNPGSAGHGSSSPIPTSPPTPDACSTSTT
jgi:ArsR family transcriptional regulator